MGCWGRARKLRVLQVPTSQEQPPVTAPQCPAWPNRATISGFFCRQTHAWSCLLHGHLENFLQLLGTGLPLKKNIISPCNLTCFWGKASSGVGENLLEKREKNNYGKNSVDGSIQATPCYHLQSHLCSPKNLIPGNNSNAKNLGSLTNTKHNPTVQLKREKA